MIKIMIWFEGATDSIVWTFLYLRGSIPEGRILKRAKCMNPVIYFDG